MDITGREVARLLGLGQEAARRVLAAGLAGPAHPRGGGNLYSRDHVHALMDRRVVAADTPLPAACAAGVLVGRVGRDVPPSPAVGPWRLATGRAVVLTMLVAEHGRVPMVCTVAGYVLGGADVVGRTDLPDDPRRSVLTVRPPGDWFSVFADARVPTGPGDPLLFWRCRLCPPIPRDPPYRVA